MSWTQSAKALVRSLITSSNKPFGLDVSQHQGILNWDAIATHTEEVRFVGIRAGISWGFEDALFKTNWAGAKRVSIPRMAYHVVYFGEHISRQVDNLSRILGNDIGEMPVVADVELDRGQSKATITSQLDEYTTLLQDRFGKPPIIYSRAGWLNQFVDIGWMREKGMHFDYWLAQYLRLGGVEHAGPPQVPNGITADRILIHQTSDTMPGIGTPKATNEMDYNRWVQSEDILFWMSGEEDDYSDMVSVAVAEQLGVVADEVMLLADIIHSM